MRTGVIDCTLDWLEYRMFCSLQFPVVVGGAPAGLIGVWLVLLILLSRFQCDQLQSFQFQSHKFAKSQSSQFKVPKLQNSQVLKIPDWKVHNKKNFQWLQNSWWWQIPSYKIPIYNVPGLRNSQWEKKIPIGFLNLNIISHIDCMSYTSCYCARIKAVIYWSAGKPRKI